MSRNRTNREKTIINVQPSKPINIAERRQNANVVGQKTQKLETLTHVEVPAEGKITAGSWVAETEKSNIRKNKLRIGR